VNDTDKIDVGSSRDAFENYESLDVDHDEASYLVISSSSVMPPRKGGVPSEQDLYTEKYIA
jgi:hypothetical protein